MIEEVFDIETDNLYDHVTKIHCIAVGELNTDEITVYGPDELEKALERLSQADRLIGHNILGYDFPVMEKLLGWTPGPSQDIEDTYVISRVLNPDRRLPWGFKGKGGPHSLARYAWQSGDRKVDNEVWTEFTPVILERVIGDVKANKYACKVLREEQKGHNWDRAIKLEHEVQRIITQQEINGVNFDKDLAEKVVKDLEDMVEEIDSKLLPSIPMNVKQFGTSVLKPFKVTGELVKRVLDWADDEQYASLIKGPFTRLEWIPINLSSTAQVKDYLLNHTGWVPTEWNFRNGQRTSPKLTEDSYESIGGEIGSLIKRRILIKHRQSQICGWIERIRDDGRIAASANTCGTNTGRFRHRGVVNVPKASDSVFLGKEMRSMFCQSEGRRFVGHDADGLELRMLAHYMDDPEFTEAVVNGNKEDGTDIHTMNMKAAGLSNRDQAKTFIYGFLYGAGNDKIGEIVGGTAEDGARLKKRFLANLPALARLIKNVKRASKKGWLKGLDGRKVWMRRDDAGQIMEHKSLNTLLQSAGAVVMKESMVVLDQQVSALGLDVLKVIDMHDEAQADVALKDVEKYVELAGQSVVQAGKNLGLRVELAAEADIGNNWAETH